jgi:hypothetical protein
VPLCYPLGIRLKMCVGLAMLGTIACDAPHAPSPPIQAPPVPTSPPPAPPASPADVVVMGIVHETAPTEVRVISGATVTAVSGDQTRTTTADARGRFSVTIPAGEIRLAVTAPRYEQTMRTFEASSDVDVEVALPYIFRTIDERWYMPCCKPSTFTKVTVDLPVHYSGTIRFVAGVCILGCAASEFTGNCGEIRDDAGTVLLRTTGSYDGGTGGSVEVAGGSTYQVSAWQCGPPVYANAPLVMYEIIVTRPI